MIVLDQAEFMVEIVLKLLRPLEETYNNSLKEKKTQLSLWETLKMIFLLFQNAIHQERLKKVEAEPFHLSKRARICSLVLFRICWNNKD